MFYTFAVALGALAMGPADSLRAGMVSRTAEVTIPCQFHVNNRMMPSGEYRLEQEIGSELATLVNTKTGQRVRVIRPATMRTAGKASFTLVPDKNGYKLKVS